MGEVWVSFFRETFEMRESKETAKFHSHEFEDAKYIFGKSQSEPIFVILSIFFLSSGNFLNIVGVFGQLPESIYIPPDFS